MSDFIQITIVIRKTDQLFSISVAPSCPLSSLFSVPACVNILEMLNVRDLAGFKLREVRIWSEKVLNVAPRPGSILSEAFWVAIFYFCDFVGTANISALPNRRTPRTMRFRYRRKRRARPRGGDD